MSKIGTRLRNFLQLDSSEVIERWRGPRSRKKQKPRGESSAETSGVSKTAEPSSEQVSAAVAKEDARPGREESGLPSGKGVSSPLAGAAGKIQQAEDRFVSQKEAVKFHPVSPKVSHAGAVRTDTKALAPPGKSRILRKTIALKKRVVSLFSEALSRIAAALPFEIAPSVRFENLPETSRVAVGFALASALGFALSAGLMLLFRRRAPYFSLPSALIVAIAVIVVFRGETGFPVGVFAAGLALFSLVLGEMVVQLLHRADIVRLIDVLGFPTGSKEGMLYRRYYFNLLVIRVIPAVALSFLIGLWPFKKMIRYRGFGNQ